jgi:hypothetical protein
MSGRRVTPIQGYCPRCLLWHDTPTLCTHDISAPCPHCGKPFGGRWTGQTGDACWRCWDTAQEAQRRGDEYCR